MKRLLDENADLKARIASIELQLHEVSRSATFSRKNTAKTGKSIVVWSPGDEDEDLSSEDEEDWVTITKWTELAHISMADVSTLAVIGLPVQVSELDDGSHYMGLTVFNPDETPGLESYEEQMRQATSMNGERTREAPPPKENPFRKGKTRMPKRLVHIEAIMDLGYPVEEEEFFYIVQLALEKEHIDELIKLSEMYKDMGKLGRKLLQGTWTNNPFKKGYHCCLGLTMRQRRRRLSAQNGVNVDITYSKR